MESIDVLNKNFQSIPIKSKISLSSINCYFYFSAVSNFRNVFMVITLIYSPHSYFAISTYRHKFEIDSNGKEKLCCSTLTNIIKNANNFNFSLLYIKFCRCVFYNPANICGNVSKIKCFSFDIKYCRKHLASNLSFI